MNALTRLDVLRILSDLDFISGEVGKVVKTSDF